jgi:hypothetical protein
MQKLKVISGSTAALFVALLVVTAVPVFAHEGEDHTSSSTSGTNKTRTTDDSVKSTTISTTSSSDDPATHDVNDDSTSRNRSSKSAQAATAKQARTEVKALQNSEKRKKACVARTHGMETKFNRIITNSERHHERIGSILTKAVSYQKEHNVSAENFDALVADASTKSAAAQQAIENLKAVEPKIDCNNNGQVAVLVNTFKTQAEATREALKAYKQSVKAVLQALIKAKEATTTEDSTSTDSNTTTEGTN